MAIKVEWRHSTASSWTPTNPVLAQGEKGVETDTGQFKIGDGSTAWTSLAYQGTTGPTQTMPYRSLGDGSDGNVTISSGTTTLTRDMFYNNLTLNGTGILSTNGYRVFVKGVLDITAAAAGAIQCNGGNGGNASSATAGSAGTSTTTNTLGSGGVGGAGATGTTGAGSTGGAGGGNNSPSNGGTNGTSGAGGAGTNAAGNATAAVTIQNIYPVRRFETNLMAGASLINGGFGGRGGASGGGDNTNSGGGGGGSGGGGGVIALYVNSIVKGASTPAGVIQATGGNGGNGGNGTAGVTGGGGGGSGGGGGWVYLVYNQLFGPTISNLINASGGNGGNGGNGFGGGTGGNGANAAMPGSVTLYNIPSGSGNNYLGPSNTGYISELIGSGNIGATGGDGGFGATLMVSL